jgi:acetolactate synthase-1/2/3 large subunit
VRDLPAVLARTLQSRRPAVLDCRTRFVPHPCMAAFASMNRFGT